MSRAYSTGAYTGGFSTTVGATLGTSVRSATQVSAASVRPTTISSSPATIRSGTVQTSAPIMQSANRISGTTVATGTSAPIMQSANRISGTTVAKGTSAPITQSANRISGTTVATGARTGGYTTGTVSGARTGGYTTGTVSGYTGGTSTLSSGTIQQARVVSGPATTPTIRTATTPSMYSSSPVKYSGSTLTSGTTFTSGFTSGSTLTSGTTFTSGTTLTSGAYGATAARVLSSGAPIQVGEVRPNTISGPSYTQSAYETKHKDDPQLQNLKELRKTSGLKNIGVNTGLQGFKKMASDGKLTREQFIAAYVLLLQENSQEVPEDSIKNAVFDLFDRDDNNVVDMMEVICGVSLLCSGSEEDKIHAVFDIFDENGDGVITMDEMFKFLTSVFKVVLTPNVMGVMNSMGVTVESAEDLASVTALECFKTADLNHDGKLSVTEFKNWFFAPRNDPSFLFSPVRKLLQ